MSVRGTRRIGSGHTWSENVFSIDKENESVHHNSGSLVIGLNVFSNKYKVGFNVSCGEEWSREGTSMGSAGSP